MNIMNIMNVISDGAQASKLWHVATAAVVTDMFTRVWKKFANATASFHVLLYKTTKMIMKKFPRNVDGHRNGSATT